MSPMSLVRLQWRDLRVPLALAVATFTVACSDPNAPIVPRVSAAAHPDVAPAILVTNTDDAGPGSLRQAQAPSTRSLWSAVDMSDALSSCGPGRWFGWDRAMRHDVRQSVRSLP